MMRAMRGGFLSRSLARFLVLTLLILVETARPTTRVVIVGDSITYGAGEQGKDYVSSLREKLGTEYEIVRMGLAGGCSWQGLYLEEAIKALRPDILVIYFGSNDVKRIHGGSATWQHFEEAIARLAGLADQTIIVTPHRGHETPEHNYYLEDVAKAREILISLKKPVVDLYSACCSEDELTDYVHPNPTGHKHIADEMYKMIIRVSGGAN